LGWSFCDGKKAGEIYSGLHYAKPYMLEMVLNIVTRPNVSKMYKRLSDVNRTLAAGIFKTIVHLLGFEHPNGVIEAFGFSHITENEIYPLCPVPEGTILKWTDSSPESHLAVYNRLRERLTKPKAVLVSSCLLRPYWINFEYEKVKEKMNELGVPYLIIYLAGEIGVHPNEKTDIIHHSCSI